MAPLEIAARQLQLEIVASLEIVVSPEAVAPLEIAARQLQLEIVTSLGGLSPGVCATSRVEWRRPRDRQQRDHPQRLQRSCSAP